MNVIEEMRRFSELAQRHLDKGSGPPPDCKPGCAACCYQWVSVSASEAMVIAEHVRARGQGKEVVGRLKAHEEATRLAGDRAEYWRLHVPCPFLVEGDLCGIYDVRPMPCRHLFSFDAHACHDPDPGTQTPNWREAMDAGVGMQLRIMELEKGTPATKLPLDFTRAVRIALQRPNYKMLLLTGKDPFRSARIRAFHMMRDEFEMDVPEMNQRTKEAGEWLQRS